MFYESILIEIFLSQGCVHGSPFCLCIFAKIVKYSIQFAYFQISYVKVVNIYQQFAMFLTL